MQFTEAEAGAGRDPDLVRGQDRREGNKHLRQGQIQPVPDVERFSLIIGSIVLHMSQICQKRALPFQSVC